MFVDDSCLPLEQYLKASQEPTPLEPLTGLHSKGKLLNQDLTRVEPIQDVHLKGGLLALPENIRLGGR